MNWLEGHPDPFPPEPDFEPIHARDYLVRAWKISDRAILLRGAVMDNKPAHMFAARIAEAGGRPFREPVTMHHMVIDLTVSFPELVVTDAAVVFESFPQPGCPAIADSYRQLVGLSIARGFTHEVRQRFGGPRGCTHTTALLQAMGPVAVQCIFSMRRVGAAPAGAGAGAGAGTGGQSDRADSGPPGGQPSFMRDTCHVWSAEGELWQGITMGRRPPVVLPLQHRYRQAGVEPVDVEPD